jgi:hypothetical protein
MQWVAIPDRYQDSTLNAEGAHGRCPFMQNCPSLYCHGFLAAFGGTGIADNYNVAQNMQMTRR